MENIVIKNLISMLTKSLRSDLIKNDRPFMGKKLIENSLYIRDIPNYDSTLHYDFEGNYIVTKTLIDKGVLINLLTDISSKHIMKKSNNDENRLYNYRNNSDEVSESNIILEMPKQKKYQNIQVGIIVKGFLNESALYDVNTGYLDFKLFGNYTNSGTLKQFVLKMHIVELLNKLIILTDVPKQVENCIV